MVPWSREFTTMYAHLALGEHIAPAIVVCCLYFTASVLTVLSFLKTKYSWYDVLLISTLFRTLAYGVRAAYLVHYWPALGGVFLAFLNAGFGANIAAHCILTITWLKANGLHFYGVEQRYLLKWICLILVVSVLMFGPICGVIAAGMEYGAYTRYVVTYGERLRIAASFGLASVTFGLICVSARLCLTVFITQRRKSGLRAATAKEPARQPRLIGLVLIAACLLAVRGAVGCVALYTQRKYEKWWDNDKFFYSFDALPELLVLCIDCWPMLYARIGQAYPKPLGVDEESSRHDSSHNGDRAGKHEADGLDERERENGSNKALKEQ